MPTLRKCSALEVLTPQVSRSSNRRSWELKSAAPAAPTPRMSATKTRITKASRRQGGGAFRNLAKVIASSVPQSSGPTATACKSVSLRAPEQPLNEKHRNHGEE